MIRSDEAPDNQSLLSDLLHCAVPHLALRDRAVQAERDVFVAFPDCCDVVVVRVQSHLRLFGCVVRAVGQPVSYIYRYLHVFFV